MWGGCSLGKHPGQVALGSLPPPAPTCQPVLLKGRLSGAQLEEQFEPCFSRCTAPGALFAGSRGGATPGTTPQHFRAWSPQIRPARGQMQPGQQFMGRWGPGAGKRIGLPESSAPTTAWGPQAEKSPCPR